MSRSDANNPPQAQLAQPARSGEPPIITMIRQMEGEIKRALPRHITPERMIRMATTCVRQTPKLLECDPLTTIAAIVELSQLGLEPSTPLGHAWILPYGHRTREGRGTAQVIIGYKGFIALADRAGISMTAEVVREQDMIPPAVFRYRKGTSEFIEHLPSDEEDAGPLLYAYAIATRPDRRQLCRVINRGDIARAKAASAAWRAGQADKSRRDSPWYVNEDSMWRKTAIRRLASFIPMSAEFVRAVDMDYAAERGVPQIFDLTPPESQISMAADAIDMRLAAAKQDVLPAPAPPAPPLRSLVPDILTAEMAADPFGGQV